MIVFRYSWYSAIFVLAGWIYEHKMGNYSGVTIFALKITAKISKMSVRCKKNTTNSTLHRFPTLHFEVRIKSVYGIIKTVIVVYIWIDQNKSKMKTSVQSEMLWDRVAELGSLSSGTKMAMKIFVKHVFTIFATNASFLRVIANLQI